MSTLLVRSVIGCALLGSAAFAEDISDIMQSTDYKYVVSPNTNRTASFSNIEAPSITIQQFSNGSGTFNVEANNLTATKTIRIAADSSAGNLALNNIEGKRLEISTQNGTITLSGDVKAEDNTSWINITNEGTIVLNGANCENVSMEYNKNVYNEDEKYGEIQISGDTTLSNVFFRAKTVNVADDANLTLDDVFFAHRNAIEQEEGANTALTLGDNVTLTLAEGSKLDVTELTIGTGLNLVITLSKEAFATLDNTTFDIFSVQEGEVDLTGANVSFTDGEQTKTGTITAEGGSITVTDSYVVPEPTTATLSLLALAALAARRRRK